MFPCNSFIVFLHSDISGFIMHLSTSWRFEDFVVFLCVSVYSLCVFLSSIFHAVIMYFLYDFHNNNTSNG